MEYKILVGKDSITLAQLRELRGFNQNEVGRRMGVSQPAVSKLEHRENPKMSSVRRFVEALGGTLKAGMRDKQGMLHPIKLG